MLYCVKVSLAARKNLAVERHKRVAHFGKFAVRETNMELGQLPSSNQT